MVKLSLVLVIAACAIMGKSVLIEAVDAVSSSNDTSASIDVAVGDESMSNDDSASVAATASPVYDNSAGSIGSTDVDTPTNPATTTVAPAVDNGSVQSGSSISDATDVIDDSSGSVDADTTSPSVITATPSVDDGSAQTGSSTIASVDGSASVDADTTVPPVTTATPSVDDGSVQTDVRTIPSVDGSASVDADTTSPIATTVTPTNGGSVLTDSGDDSTLHDTSDATDAPTPTPTVANPDTPAPTVKGGPIPISGQLKLVPGYEDCGGLGFNYKVYLPKDVDTNAYTMLTCEQGFRCQEVQGSSTYRCKDWPSRDPVPFYGQCGGGNYDGQTFCAPGAVCKYISASFSQCLPTY